MQYMSTQMHSVMFIVHCDSSFTISPYRLWQPQTEGRYAVHVYTDALGYMCVIHVSKFDLFYLFTDCGSPRLKAVMQYMSTRMHSVMFMTKSEIEGFC